MPKPPPEFCLDDFEYKEYTGLNNWSDPQYEEPILIKNVRIDRGAEYSTSTNGKQLLYNGVIFCYADITSPLPEFKTESVVVIDGQDHVVTKVIPNYEAYSKKLYSYELEVV
ncbi:putative minor capsid protein [Alkalibacterium sp. MB6]|uniref:putative minor capsid protein n=1 Tax=Alkalibacterium sp. MB6 TaxID=2081965 RepID=UPI00137A4269|nr:putative minor capsid protein [Alkalibacterium sp. MB6]